VFKRQPEIRIGQPLSINWDEVFEIDVYIRNTMPNILNNVKATPK